ncbi:ABC transporter substrate-binding protein [Subtercola endophyticus]|uniref:ABC transporter substrate-binding protein n=1 Tax=Subtercola endophyticus TaxID=2895559 RepID=UPI001E36C300|nr:extracellular solute-binding protein [Subtercola endophyticus]UFS57950.1 extracellular solute-binding protein [Subtercola endophyticus]
MRITRAKRVIIPLAGVAAVALALTGCTGDAPASSTGTSAAGCEDYADYGTFTGSPTVNIYGTIVDVEADQLNQSWADFEKCTGITIKYEGSQEFETQINVRAQGGNPPDLAIFPQPGLLAKMVDGGYIKAPAKSVEDNVDKNWSADWKKYGTVDGTFYAAPLMASVKGYIWYSPAFFKDNGYTIPTTLDELTSLTAKIAADGKVKPWCAGFSSGEASGWPGTDWIEDTVLRQSGTQVYDDWTTNKVKFTDPQITKAFDYVGSILKNPAYVNGGFGDVTSINSTTFQDAGLPILQDQCAMMHQASFYEAQWPEGTTVSPDGDVYGFLMPPAKAGDPQAVTGGGEMVGAFKTSDEITAVQTYLSSALWANNRVSIGGVISANKGLDPNNAKSPLAVDSIKILQDPNTTFRFDASDLMPAAVGSNSFWKGIVNWINGDDTQTVTTFIQSTWPQ